MTFLAMVNNENITIGEKVQEFIVYVQKVNKFTLFFAYQHRDKTTWSYIQLGIWKLKTPVQLIKTI